VRTSEFIYRSIVEAPAPAVFHWHERPDAIEQLLPARLVRLEHRSGGIRDGGRVVLSVGAGPWRFLWEARHFGYVKGEQFCDEQVRGPFALWRHTHRVEAIGAWQTLYEDRVEFALRGGGAITALIGWCLQPLLRSAFARRHAVVRAQVGSHRPRTTAAHLLVAALAAVSGMAVPERAQAQDVAGTGTLRGTVSRPAGDPVADAAVCAPATGQCAITDAGGQFSLALRAGLYTLEIAAPGQALVVTGEIEVRAGLERLTAVTLPVSTGVGETVTVTAPLVSAPAELKTSARLIARESIATSAAALQDVSRFVQTLPGVAPATNDFRNDLIVRGGSPLENLFIVDNVEIPNINAFANFASAGGSVSILDAQMIDSVTFLSGGYPAPFGNRTSGVLQIAQREGRRDRVEGRATVGFAGAGVVLEGPAGRSGKGSWIVSARRSFLDLVTDDTGIGGVPVVYTLNAKAVYDLSPRDRIWAVNVSGIDNIRLGLTESSDLSDELSNLDIRYEGWRSAGGVNWQRVFTRGVGLLGVTHARASVAQRVTDLLRNGLPAAGTPVAEQLAGGALVFREQSAEAETTVKYDLTLAVRFAGTLQAGGSIRAARVDYDAASPFGTDSPYFPRDSHPLSVRTAFTAWQGGGYVQATRSLTARLSSTAGVRLDRYGFLDATRISPRVAAEYTLTPRARLRASYGQYSQQPFFLFLTAYPQNRALDPFRSDHYVAGVTIDAGTATRVSIEAFAKRYRAYPVSADIPSLSLANIGDTFAVRDILFPMVGAGRGAVDGVEAFVERRASPDGRVSGEANLAFSRARHAGRDGILRPGSFDYPIIANAAGRVRLTPAWRMSANVAYLAGRPLTPFDADRSSAERRAVYDLERVNAMRAPDYFRLDLRLDRVFDRGGRQASIFAGVQNVTNRRNVAGYTWDRRANTIKRLDQLGIFPMLGLEWPF
jgi:ligand-binding SRPBCC domain-containing protein